MIDSQIARIRGQICDPPTWILVAEDSLPPRNETVLVVDRFNSRYLAYWDGVDWSALPLEEIIKPTHWMPLPPNPERK